MPTIVLNTQEEALVGFILVAGKESLEDGGAIRDCILTCPPNHSPDMQHPISLARTEYLHKEHLAKVSVNEGKIDLNISIADQAQLSISLSSDAGSWSINGAFGNTTGACLLAKPK